MKPIFLAAVVFATTPALADEAPPPTEPPPLDPPTDPPTDPPPTDPPPTAPPVGTAGAAGGLTLSKGALVIAGQSMMINLSDESVGKPISFAPSVWYGVDDKLTLGLTHDLGTTPWSPRVVFPGFGVCVSGESNGCGNFYNNVSFEGLYSLSTDQLSVALHPAVDILSFDPDFEVGLRIGVLGRYAIDDKMSIVFDPRVYFQFTEREAGMGGGVDVIDLPVWFWYAIDSKISAYAGTGFLAPFDGIGDFYLIPFLLGATFKIDEKIAIGGNFNFLNLLGSNGGAEARALGLYGVFKI